MEHQIRVCTEDIRFCVKAGAVSLEAQVRAYDLLEALLEAQDDGGLHEKDASDSGLSEEARDYCALYEESKDALTAAFDSEALLKQAEEAVAPFRKAMNDARFEAAAAASLHEFAKETFHVWQTAGIFARRRALRELRKRAGFRLESHRIGNYVAKTFDLQNEAQSRFARAQQALFAADASFKCRSEAYSRIFTCLNTYF